MATLSTTTASSADPPSLREANFEDPSAGSCRSNGAHRSDELFRRASATWINGRRTGPSAATFVTCRFSSPPPTYLQEDRETVLGTSGDAKIILKSSQEKKLSLEKISFPQWSAANFRIMHTFMKDGTLSTTQDVMDYIMHSSKVSELAKCYPLPRN
ncbi:hypothetical protein OS493_000373 [Desmophyllum pertusum]|uniref:Uncharacterized protein n=1 Tax=Desmophyllum pertusum TaxID=174260 RepID=A0A9X0DBL2_9CNID|nr:hypothetical protein OS493_000373 [Desmophyllum pertusum]